MATCARCGAEILWKRLDGMPFAVDVHESTQGEDRYVERGNLLLRARPTSEVAGFVAHRLSCSSAR